MNPSPAAKAWAAQNVTHFCRLLIAATLLFVATEIVALFGIVPHLRPLSLQDITGNILFAIGFGCPFVLHISSLPRLRELAITLPIGAALAFAVQQFHRWTGLPAEYKPDEVMVAEIVTGLGLASLGAMSLRAWRKTDGERTEALAYLLPAAVALMITLEAGIFLYCIKSLCPTSCDPAAYAADEAYGIQWSFGIGRLFAEVPMLQLVCYAIYVAPPPSLVFVYALQTRAWRPPPVDAATVLLAVFVAGYSLYYVFPVCGPKAAFPNAFPQAPPPLDGLLGTQLQIPGEDAWPNGMPSLHIASVVLAYWQARPYGIWARLAAGVFLVGTFLATLGMGEHYLVDLVVGLPLSLAVYAICMPARPPYRRQRRAAIVSGAMLLVFWYTLLFCGIDFLLSSKAIAWGISIATILPVVILERLLYNAAIPDPWDAEVRPT